MLLSLCMIVKNEEENLERCLKSVKQLTDEMIVVDTGSTDRTPEIAVSFGAKVYHYAWKDDFADARNYSLSLAQGDWILIMDADDELERGGAEKIRRLLQQPDDDELFCCQTLCYLGETPDPGSILINMNIRLIRNRKGYRYTGRIHEQISSCSGTRPCVHAADIIFYHYGYLKEQIERKEKHKRNIDLIRKELADDPDNAYMLFCLGNEYLATQKAGKALNFYRRSFMLTNVQAGYRSALLVRMILCCSQLRLSREQDALLAEGIRSYPNLTDFVYLKACALQQRKKLESAIRYYKKCIRMGDPPFGSNSTMGISTYQAQYALSILYTQMGETGKALRCCTTAIKSAPHFREALEKMTDLLLALDAPPEFIQNKMARLAANNFKSCMTLSDIFYNRQMYREALCMCRRAKRFRPDDPILAYDEGVCKFHMNQYSGASRCLAKVNDKELSAKAYWFRILCAILEKNRLPHGTQWQKQIEKPYYETARECLHLVRNEAGEPFSESDVQNYAASVYSLLNLLLACGEIDVFQKSLPLLNRIGDPASYLNLGKLYYKNGYEKSAYYELLRSICLSGMIDAEGISILKDTYPIVHRSGHS